MFWCHFKILLAISEVQLTLPYVLYVLYVKSSVPLKWNIGFENGIKMTPIFTIISNSKMLIKSALHHRNILFWSMAWIYCWWYTMVMYQNFDVHKPKLNGWNVLLFLLFYNNLDLNNQKILWLPSILLFERTVYNLNHPNGRFECKDDRDEAWCDITLKTLLYILATGLSGQIFLWVWLTLLILALSF